MLVHTSRNCENHDYLALAIENWLKQTRVRDIMGLCEGIWQEETARFTKEKFTAAYPSYSQSDGGIEIPLYPSFEEIRPFIESLLKVGVGEIQVNEDGSLVYHHGLHLCVDNSDRNEDKGVVKRLAYPNSDELPEVAPAFMVIDGNTLSRGLTIEGLFSTFFLRPASCADTLMQMGRWFGYRRGYELLPRIWMSQNVKSQFDFISEMDQRLRDEIKHMAEIGVNPSDCGPKIMASPSSKWLQIVSKNKSQASTGADYDFAGHPIETGAFSPNTLKSNMGVVREFLISLGAPAKINNPFSDRNIVWKSIKWSCIKKFLETYKWTKIQKGVNELKPFYKWMDTISQEGTIKNWNVILAGVKDGAADKCWTLAEGISIKKINRTRRYEAREDGIINIGVLRSFNDFLSDIEITDENQFNAIRNTQHNIYELNSIREKFGLHKTPLLVVYIIDKNSQPDSNSRRFPLNTEHDIAGFSIYIPGYRNNRSSIKSITIKIKDEETFND